MQENEEDIFGLVYIDVAKDIGGPCMYPFQGFQDGFTFKYLQVRTEFRKEYNVNLVL